VRHHAKCRADRSNRSGDMAIFRFCFKMAAICHRLFVIHRLHPRRVFDGLCHCVRLGWNRWRSFDNMQVLLFCALGLKMSMSIHTPKCFFCDLPPKWGAVLTRPQKAHRCAKTRRMTCRSLKLIHWCGRKNKAKNKYNKKGILKNQHVASHVFAHSIHNVAALHGLACVGIFQQARNPFRGLGAQGVEIYPFPLLWLSQQLVLPYKP